MKSKQLEELQKFKFKSVSHSGKDTKSACFHYELHFKHYLISYTNTTNMKAIMKDKYDVFETKCNNRNNEYDCERQILQLFVY